MADRWMVAVAAALALSGCATGKKAPLAVAGPADPVADHCLAQGGVIEARQGADGEARMCRLQDGRICEAQSLLSDKVCADPRL